MKKGISTDWIKKAVSNKDICCPEVSAFPSLTKDNLKRDAEFQNSQTNYKNSQPK